MSVDLSTKYLGFDLYNPLVASAGPLTASVESLRRLENAGVAAVVLPSLFEEQILHEEQEINRLYEQQTQSFAESLDYFPEVEEILGEKVYRTIEGIPGEVDIVDVFRRPDDIPAHLPDIIAKRPKAG